MDSNFEITFKTAFYSSKQHLKISPELIELSDDKNIIVRSFSKLEIAEFRYGVKAINGYRFRIGRIYCINIKNVSGEIIKIRLKSIYRINKRKLEQKYLEILNSLNKNFIRYLLEDYVKLFYEEKEFSISGFTFKKHGVQIKKASTLISWDDVRIKKYKSHFTIFSNKDPSVNQYNYYRTEWNCVITISLINYILKEKKIII